MFIINQNSAQLTAKDNADYIHQCCLLATDTGDTATSITQEIWGECESVSFTFSELLGYVKMIFR